MQPPVVEIGARWLSQKKVDAAVTVLIAGGVACEARRLVPASAVRSAIPCPADYDAAGAKGQQFSANGRRCRVASALAVSERLGQFCSSRTLSRSSRRPLRSSALCLLRL